MTRIHKHEAKCRIICDATPAAATFGSWKYEAGKHSIGRVRPHVDGLIVDLRTVLLGLRRNFADFRAGHAVSRETGRFQWKWLRWPRLIAKCVELRHRPLLDSKQ